MFLLNDHNSKKSFTTRVRAALSNIVPKKMNKWSASLLALLIFVPVLVAALVNANQSDPSTSNNSELFIQETTVDELTQTVRESGSQVEVKTNSHVQGNSGSQVNVQGSISTTTDEGTKTESFEKTFNSADGNSSNSFNVNVNVNSDSEADVDIDADSDSSVEVDFDESTEVRIRN